MNFSRYLTRVVSCLFIAGYVVDDYVVLAADQQEGEVQLPQKSQKRKKIKKTRQTITSDDSEQDDTAAKAELNSIVNSLKTEIEKLSEKERTQLTAVLEKAANNDISANSTKYTNAINALYKFLGEEKFVQFIKNACKSHKIKEELNDLSNVLKLNRKLWGAIEKYVQPAETSQTTKSSNKVLEEDEIEAGSMKTSKRKKRTKQKS